MGLNIGLCGIAGEHPGLKQGFLESKCTRTTYSSRRTAPGLLLIKFPTR